MHDPNELALAPMQRADGGAMVVGFPRPGFSSARSGLGGQIGDKIAHGSKCRLGWGRPSVWRELRALHLLRPELQLGGFCQRAVDTLVVALKGLRYLIPVKGVIAVTEELPGITQILRE